MWTKLKHAVVVVLAAGILPIVSTAGNPCPANTDIGDDCGLTGIWKNELNSTAVFCCSDGQIKGLYRSIVGAATGFYELSGRYTKTGPNNDVTVVSWSVAWNNSVRGNSNSTTSWTGIHYPAEGVIYTQYIYLKYAERANLWQSSWINHNDFRRFNDGE